MESAYLALQQRHSPICYTSLMDDCIFCKIAKHEAPATIDLDNEDVIAFRSINPVADTHILIMPKKHMETFLDLEEVVVSKMLKTAQELIKKNKIENAYKLVFNGGQYQEIAHVHWHLLGGELEDKKNILNKL